MLFPDTNIFVEAKDLKQLPWDELATEEITLLVCSAVRKEIDDHKTNDKNRVRKRALEWNSEFKKVLRPNAAPLVLREIASGVPRIDEAERGRLAISLIRSVIRCRNTSELHMGHLINAFAR